VLISFRRFSVVPLEVSAVQLIARHPSFLLRIVEYRGGIVEDRLFEAPRHRSIVTGWPVLSLVLEGSGIARDAAAQVVAGRSELVWVPDGTTFRGRIGEEGIRAIILQWDPAVFGRLAASAFSRARIGSSDFARIFRAAGCIAAARYDLRRSSVALADLFATLRALGLTDARPDAGDLVARVDPAVVSIGARLDQALSGLSANPMSIDLERSLARSAAQTRRLVRSYGELLLLPGCTNWRELRNSWRLYIGTLLMTSKRGHTDQVAKLLGYGSAEAFCHAFANAGLPAPGNIRRVVQELA
jgi:hypothetical protein